MLIARGAVLLAVQGALCILQEHSGYCLPTASPAPHYKLSLYESFMMYCGLRGAMLQNKEQTPQ